jgi:hypothetical protein
MESPFDHFKAGRAFFPVPNAPADAGFAQKALRLSNISWILASKTSCENVTPKHSARNK